MLPFQCEQAVSRLPDRAFSRGRQCVQFRPMLNRTSRFIAIAALLFAPALIAQVPSASDPPRYVLPPRNVVDVFDAEPLPQTLVSPNHQVVALARAKAY